VSKSCAGEGHGIGEVPVVLVWAWRAVVRIEWVLGGLRGGRLGRIERVLRGLV
jgi:hypothetical protein